MSVLARIREKLLTQAVKDNYVAGLMIAATLALAGSVWLWIKSGFDAGAAWTAAKLLGIGLWAAIGRAWSWLVAPVGIPNGLVCLLGLGIVVYGRRRVRAVLDRRRELKESTTKLQAPPDKRLLTVSSATKPDVLRTVLGLLGRDHPQAVAVKAIAMLLSDSYAAAELICEEMERMGMLTILPGGYGPKEVVLTTKGRDYWLTHNLDLI
jgi:hypothetical protein